MKKLLAILLALLLLAQPMTAWALTYSGSASYKTGKYYTALTAVTLTGNQRTDIVNIAKSQIGYQEGGSSSELSGEVKGGNNYTEYGKWYGLQDMWCAMFVSWCANVAGVPSTVVPRHSYTVEGLNKFKSWGRAYTRAQVASGTYKPQAGDIIYFKSSRNTNPTNHVGIVTSYAGTTIYTVEGNTSSATISTNGGAVCAKSYDISNTYIVYVCCPNYSTGESSGGSVGTTSGTCFPACDYSYASLADALTSIGVDASLSNRKIIAEANNIGDYKGTPEQNTLMLDLLKAGQLIDPNGKPAETTKPYYYPACAGSYTGIAAALASIGVDGSYAYRKVIAAANNMEGYEGLPEQNTYMLELLKAGKLIDPEGTPPQEEPEPTKPCYYPACDASYTGIAAALASIGVDGSYTYRKVIAAANNMEGYEGLPEQNTYMLELLKAGKLIDPEGTPPQEEPEQDTRFFPKCDSSFQSIAQALSSVGVEATFAYRKEIAIANGIEEYSGTVDQNTQLLNLLKAGELLIPSAEEVPTVEYYPACAETYTTIADALLSLGVTATYANRKLIAAANNMIGYEGKPEQNTQMLALLKAGQLIVPEEGLTLSPCGCKSTYNEHITVAGTCTEDGAEYDRCTNCTAVYNKVTASAPGHVYVKTLTKPTTTTEGAWVSTCDCGDCTREIIPKRVPGDVNGDGIVNLKDSVILRRQMAGGWNVTVNEFNADVDGDDSLTLVDATLIARHLAGGWNVNLQ